jgi:hypothetical protein
MKIDQMLKRYYRVKLDGIPGLPRPEIPGRSRAVQGHGRFHVSWEDVLGAAVTAAWILAFVMPGRWFLIDRIMPVLRLGF